MYMNLRNLTGKEVTVNAQGVIYTGTLVEMTETSVLLRTSTGFCQVPMESVVSVVPTGEEGARGQGLPPSPLEKFGR